MMLTNFVNGQLDTMLIRSSITLEAQQWAWLRGKVGGSRDSAILKSDRNVNAQLRATQGLGWNTPVAIDSIPGKLIFSFYQVLRKESGEVVSWYSAMFSALSAVTQLASYYQNYEEAITRDRQAAITVGKYIYLDQ